MTNDLKTDNYYAILDGKVVVTVRDSNVWTKWFKDFENRKVAETVIGDKRVSTVFLGLNYGFGTPRALWFESLVFGVNDRDLNEQEYRRYQTWHEAMRGHKRLVGLVREGERKKRTPKTKRYWEGLCLISCGVTIGWNLLTLLLPWIGLPVKTVSFLVVAGQVPLWASLLLRKRAGCSW